MKVVAAEKQHLRQTHELLSKLVSKVVKVLSVERAVNVLIEPH